MQAFAKTAAGEGNVGVIDVPRPEIPDDGVLVEVAYAGLCGSDLGIYTFTDAFDFMEFPQVIGHEYSGTVVEVGERVTRFDTGDRVVEEPVRSCGECYLCRSGSTNICTDARVTGVHHDGAFAEYVAVPEDALHHVPDGLPLADASIVEPLSVGYHAVDVSRVAVGDVVLVEGPGPIGLLTAEVARSHGAEVVVSGIERDAPVRLPIASELGFETIDVSDEDVEAMTESRTDGLGYDVVFDTTGHPTGLQTAARLARKGGQIVVVGLGGTSELDYADLLRAEIDIQCSYAYTWEDFERSLGLLENGSIDLEPLVDTGYSLSEGGEAFEAARTGRTSKVRFDVSDLRS